MSLRRFRFVSLLVLAVSTGLVACTAHHRPAEPVSTPPCKGVASVTWQLECSEICPNGQRCPVRWRQDDDGLFEWCGCDEEEPKDCHLVRFTPVGGQPPKALCAGFCPPGQRCKLEVDKGPVTPRGTIERSQCVCKPG